MTAKISELKEWLSQVEAAHGDLPVVLWDLDTGSYFTLAKANFDLQEMSDGTKRLSIGPNDWGDQRDGEPASRIAAST